MTPTDDEQDPNALRQRPLRMPNKVWADYDRVAAAMGTDGTSLLRDFVRYMTYDESVLPPRRPEPAPDGLGYPRLPGQIRVTFEFDANTPYKGKPRFVLLVDAPLDDVLRTLSEAGLAEGASYIEMTPIRLSTLDRAHAERILELFTEAGFTLV